MLKNRTLKKSRVLCSILVFWSVFREVFHFDILQESLRKVFIWKSFSAYLCFLFSLRPSGKEYVRAKKVGKPISRWGGRHKREKKDFSCLNEKNAHWRKDNFFFLMKWPDLEIKKAFFSLLQTPMTQKMNWFVVPKWRHQCFLESLADFWWVHISLTSVDKPDFIFLFHPDLTPGISIPKPL